MTTPTIDTGTLDLVADSVVVELFGRVLEQERQVQAELAAMRELPSNDNPGRRRHQSTIYHLQSDQRQTFDRLADRLRRLVSETARRERGLPQ